MKSTTAYLAALLGVTAIGCGSVVALEIFRPQGYNSAVTYAVIGMITPTIAVLIGVLKSIGNGEKLDEVKQHAKAAADRADVAAAAVAEAVQAKTPNKLDVVLHTSEK